MGGGERDGEMYSRAEGDMDNFGPREVAPLKNRHGLLRSSEVAPLKIGMDNFGPRR